jgi:hypothetical protein
MGRLSPILLIRPAPPRPSPDYHYPPAAVDLRSMGLPDRVAHTPRCSLWAPVGSPEVWNRLVQAASLMTVRKLAADRQAVEDDLLSHQSSPETAELNRPTTTERAKL